MSEKQWYEDLSREEIEGKHVRAVLSSGTVIEGRLEFGTRSLITVGSPIERNYILKAGVGWSLMEGVERLDLVWDERDWKRIKLSDAGDGDVLVVRGELYPITEAHFVDDPAMPIWWSVASDSYIVAPDMVSCALRRKATIPAKPGFYKDGLGEFWSRSVRSTDDRPWRSVEPDALDQPAKSDQYMSNLMPLTPVHFESGRAA